MANKRKPDVVGYPIFKVGTWNRHSFTLEDLKEIVETFHRLKDVHHVPLKLGHNDEQPLTDGQPALGWVDDVRIDGDAMVADFADVPDVVKKLIQKRRFRKVSIELVYGAEYEGETIKVLLDAVAILGADQPAVRTLPDLSMYLASRSLGDEGGRRATFKGQAQRSVFSLQLGEKRMDEEEIKRRIADAVQAATGPLQTRLDQAQEEISKWRNKFSEEETKRITAETEAKTLKAEFTQIEETAKKERVKMARKNVTELLETAVKAKKITPAQRERATKMFGVDDDVRVVAIDLDEVRDFFSLTEADRKVVEGEGGTAVGGGAGQDEGDSNRKHKDVFKEIEHRVQTARQANASLTYKQALHAVFEADKELHQEYLSTETPKEVA